MMFRGLYNKGMVELEKKIFVKKSCYLEDMTLWRKNDAGKYAPIFPMRVFDEFA